MASTCRVIGGALLPRSPARPGERNAANGGAGSGGESCRNLQLITLHAMHAYIAYERHRHRRRRDLEGRSRKSSDNLFVRTRFFFRESVNRTLRPSFGVLRAARSSCLDLGPFSTFRVFEIFLSGIPEVRDSNPRPFCELSENFCQGVQEVRESNRKPFC
eukprot:Gb_35709 [translate_table: standard]